MKKILFLMMAVAIIGCNRQSNTQSRPASDMAAAEVVTIENGQLSFYDVQKQSAIPYTDETDSVINCVFDYDNHLYYTVANNQNLTLKMLDLHEKNPQPKVCCDWHLTINDITDFMMSDQSGITISPDQKSVRIQHHALSNEDYLSEVRSCDLVTGELSETSTDDFYRELNETDPLRGERFIKEGLIYYHINPTGSKTALNDKIHLDDYFEGDELADLEFTAIRIDPTGKKVVYETTLFWGEGWGNYCLANLDGSSQQLIGDSDIWKIAPEWTSNGSLVYVGQEPRPTDDPNYEEWNDTWPCIKLMETDGTIKTIGHSEKFAVKPVGPNPGNEVHREALQPEGSELVILENGKMTLYNSISNQFTSIDQEADSVVNATFIYEDNLYYTVSIGDELYLKNCYLSNYGIKPYFVADWNLNVNDCISETYGTTARLMSYPKLYRIGLPFDFSWEVYSFGNTRFYDLTTHEQWDGWKEDDETDSFDDEFLQWDEDMSKFTKSDNNFYYNNHGSEVCLTDKINFKDYASDISYYEDPSFDFCSIDPTNKSVCFMAIIEYGDLGHGPLCFASLDGKIQLAFEDTDAAELTYGWLNDGSLVYLGQENDTLCIKRVTPDGQIGILSHAHDFVTLH